ncbi:MAG TPA: hypothetical protein VKX17_16445 [Planctomycetota bacterium]|nr:hypothetical protein [Planctomycetota bacterium]
MSAFASINAVRSKLQNARGLSMLEVMLAGMILALCACAMLVASYTSAQATKQSAEYSAAVSAARKKMEELCSTNFDALVQRYGKYNPTAGNTFKVYMDEGTQYVANNAKQSGIELPGFRKVVNGVDNFDAGEIVIVTHETNLPSTYGYSCSISSTNLWPDNGNPGGISYTGIPIDLNGDGTTTSGNCYDLSVTPAVKTAVRLPVGVVIRWNGTNGPERYELWTIITRY